MKTKTILPAILVPFTIVLALALSACGGWYENTKVGLLSANDAVNAYDDIATEVWGEKAQEDSPAGDIAFHKLETSLCFTYLVRDAIVIGWGTAAMVDAGVKKKTDFTFWAGSVLTLFDHFENVFDLWSGEDVPGYVKTGAAAVKRLLEQFNPGGIMPPGVEPIEDLDCKAVIAKHEKPVP